MSWKKVKLGDILKRRRETIKISPNEEYRLVTIRIHHKGVTQRCIMKGSEIKSPMSAVRAGDFILSGIDARNGAFGIVPNELDGAIVTNDFWCLDPDDAQIDKEFLLFLTSTDFFDYICKQSSDGMTQRIRLQKDKFYNYEIALPSIEEQKIILERLKKQKANSEILNSELTHQLDLVKKLRQQFLQEAVQGKLIRNDALGIRNTEGVGDETGAQLLNRIKAEKAKTGKKEKPLPPIKEDEIPFDIPDNWVWCRLGEVVQFLNGYAFKSEWFSSYGIKLLRNANVGINKLVWNDIAFLPLKKADEFEEYYLEEGDIILSLDRPIINAGLKIAQIKKEDLPCLLLQRVVKMKPIVWNKEYLFLWLNSSMFINSINPGRSIGIPHISHNDISKIQIPLPPLSIQAQIVAKVAALMGLCDALEAGIRESKAVNEQLLQQVLREALAG